jgi:Co/Zn/Cd efflux system component
MNQTQNRDALIVRTSVVGILTNLFLAAFKAAIGILSNSIAVTLDAVNNLSDAAVRSLRSSAPSWRPSRPTVSILLATAVSNISLPPSLR